MGKFIVLEGVTFNNPDLPILVDLSDELRAIPSLHSWSNASPENISYDNGDLILKDIVNPTLLYQKAPGRTTGPAIASAVLNSHPVIRFNGDGSSVGGMKKSVDDMPAGATTKLTFAMLARVTAADTSTQNLMCTDFTGGGGLAAFAAGASSVHQIGVAGANASFGDGKEWKLMIGSINGDVVKALSSSDLTTVESKTGSNSNLSSTFYLGQSSGNNSKFKGDLAEFMVFSDDLLDGTKAIDLQTVIDYYQTKYNL